MWVHLWAYTAGVDHFFDESGDFDDRTWPHIFLRIVSKTYPKRIQMWKGYSYFAVEQKL